MNIKKYAINNGESNVALATVNVTINGEKKEIIPAFTKFSIKRRDLSKKKILENIDKNKILPTKFAFTGTQPFRDERYALCDYYGVEIPEELDDDTLVYLDNAQTINLFELLEEPLESVEIELKSVQEAYSYIGTSFAIAQLPQKDEWIGLAAATTKENVLSQILQFAKDNKMNGTAAQYYFGLSYRIASLQKAAITTINPLEEDCSRSLEEAIKLFQAIKQAFGARCAGQTRYVKALNTSIKLSSLDDVIKALSVIDDAKKQEIITAPCEDKGQIIQDFITQQIKL